MKKKKLTKDLKLMAEKIISAEHIIQNGGDSKEVAEAQKSIMELSNKITSLEDFLLIDEYIQENFKNK